MRKARNVAPLLVCLGLLISACQPIVAPSQQQPFPPAWQATEDPAAYVQAATVHATLLVNQADGDEAAYLTQLAAWGVHDTEYTWLRHIDVDDDGQPEILLTYPLFYRPGDTADAVSPCDHSDCRRLFFIFEDNAGRYWPAPHLMDLSNGAAPYQNRPSLFAADDINADGHTEVVLREDWQGAHTAGVTLTVLRWNGAAWAEIGWMTQSYSDVRLIDIEGDGPREFVFYGGTVGSAGAGFQRKSTDIYKWNGVDYTTLAASIPDALTSETPYWKIIDGNIALFQRRYRAAERLFSNALVMLTDRADNTDLISEATGASDQMLLALARFQAMYVALQLNPYDSTNAAAHYTASQAEGGRSAAWTAAFWSIWEQTGDLAAACAAARERAGGLMMEGYNYATNPIYFRDMLCDPHYTWPPE